MFDIISSLSKNFCSTSFFIKVSSSGLFNSKSMNKLFASFSFMPIFFKIFLNDDLLDELKLSIYDKMSSFIIFLYWESLNIVSFFIF